MIFSGVGSASIDLSSPLKDIQEVSLLAKHDSSKTYGNNQKHENRQKRPVIGGRGVDIEWNSCQPPSCCYSLGQNITRQQEFGDNRGKNI